MDKTKDNPRGSPLWGKGDGKRGDNGRGALKEMKLLERQDAKMIEFPSHKRMGSLVYVSHILSPRMFSAGLVYPEAS